MRRDSVAGTFLVALVLCVVCSVVVSSAAVALHDVQERNKERDRMENVLAVAGLYDEQNPPATPIEELYAEKVTPVLIDLETGEPVSHSQVDPAQYDQRAAAKDPKLSTPITPPGALPGFRRREKYAFVYLVNDKQGKLDQMVLPVYGNGLWSTLYGFLALDADTETIRGITFYEHGETPGLGGEVDNPRWKAKWDGKKAFDEHGQIQIEVIKGTVAEESPQAEHEVDGLSGASITSRGVSDLVRYWLGPDGFGPYLDNRQSSESSVAKVESDDGRY